MVVVAVAASGKTYMQKDNSVVVPEITETKIVSGAAPHNCGGRCRSRVYVKDGVISRIVTDEDPDQNIVSYSGGSKVINYNTDVPQMRACIRCRSNRQRFYRKDQDLVCIKTNR